MLLPTRLKLEDINAICGYLSNKPTGATLPELKSVLDKKFSDEHKLNALKYLNFVENNGSKLKVTDSGRKAIKDSGAYLSDVIRDEISKVKPYRAIVERVLLQGQDEYITSNDVAVHWFDHFNEYVSESDRYLKDQAICFFHLAQIADLGSYIVGRKGKQTRFKFNFANSKYFIEIPENFPKTLDDSDVSNDKEIESDSLGEVEIHENNGDVTPKLELKSNKVFISHGQNKNILDQLKEIVVFGKFDPVVATEEESAATPVPKKVMDAMRSCAAAVIHVGAENNLYNNENECVPQINSNVLIEIGAAMALYRTNFILLVEEGIQLPSNLQGLYECRYKGNELDMHATMKLLKAFNNFD